MLTKMWGITLGYLIYDFIRNFRFHESYLKIEEYFIFDWFTIYVYSIMYVLKVVASVRDSWIPLE